MSYANGTTHYNLPQTVGTDKRDWFDSNAAFAAVDAALYAAATGQASDAEAITALQQTVAGQATDIAALQTASSSQAASISALQTSVSGIATNVADVRQDAEDMISANNEGAAATSTRAYSVGDYFIYNDVMYKATAAIAIGDTIVPNTNCVATNVDTELSQLNSDLSNHHCERVVKTLGSISSFTVNCGFKPKKVTCYGASEVTTISSIGIGNADKSAMCSFTMNNGSHGSSQGSQGVVGELYYDSNNYRVLQIDSITDTSITFIASGAGYDGDSRTAIWDLYIE